MMHFFDDENSVDLLSDRAAHHFKSVICYIFHIILIILITWNSKINGGGSMWLVVTGQNSLDHCCQP